MIHCVGQHNKQKTVATYLTNLKKCNKSHKKRFA